MTQKANTFRYELSGKWFKGNTHLHSTASDGGMEFSEIAALYKTADYDFLFRTDHWVCSDVMEDSENYPLLWIDGNEFDGWDENGKLFHVACLGKVSGITREDGLEIAIQKAHQQGAIVILAHPGWCGNELRDCFRWEFDGVEIYNHVCHWLNGKSDGLPHWNYALSRKSQFLGLAVDDAHLRPEHPGWKGGWVWVNCNDLSRKNVLDSIRTGNYYSSCGPEIHSMEYNGRSLQVECSPIRFARLVGYRSDGLRTGSFDGELMDSFEFEVPLDWRYVYLELEDDNGQRAWTNHLFTEG